MAPRADSPARQPPRCKTCCFAVTSPMEPDGIEPSTSCLQSNNEGGSREADKPEDSGDSADPGRATG